MARNKAANWERWIHGELVASLQAKGKLPKQHTVASDYKVRQTLVVVLRVGEGSALNKKKQYQFSQLAWQHLLPA